MCIRDRYADLCAQLNTDELRGGIAVNWIMNTGAAAAGEYLTDENLTRTKEYVEFLNRIYNEDQSNMSLEEMSGSFDVNAIFAEGNTYMMLNGDWTFLLFPDSDPQFEWCAAPLPHFEDIELNSTVGSTAAYCINAKTEHPEVAFDFIKFCNYSEEGAKIYAENASVPAYPSETALETYKQSVTTPGDVYKRQGYGDLRFIAKGKGGHASAPGKNTPLVRLGQFMASVEKKDPFQSRFNPTVLEMFRRLTPNMNFGMKLVFANLWLFKPLLIKLMPLISPPGAAMLHTTIAFTMAKGADGLNVLPQEAYVTANPVSYTHLPEAAIWIPPLFLSLRRKRDWTLRR